VTDVLSATLARIHPVDAAARAGAQRALDAKTKPRGSLGRLEELACAIAGIRGTATPGRVHAAVVVAAADHGVASEGVSAYPQEVTRQMLASFEAGGSAVCVLARETGAELEVVDAGVGTPTANIAAGPAMSRDDAVLLVEQGISLAQELAENGVNVVALGEMGIANTTSASALVAALLQVGPASVCGRGTGLDDEGLARKVEVVARALRANRIDPGDPLGALAALGGFEIAVLSGLALGAAENRQVVVLDGFITAVAALVAVRLAPVAADRMIAAHLSTEPGHRVALEALGLEPVLDLGLRLGEGSGAALVLPLLDASLAILSDMATFESAGVTDAGR
jgi:nicotinate-nucleotide--dimethylbenzimidazole phosphoribosyltransferase